MLEYVYYTLYIYEKRKDDKEGKEEGEDRREQETGK